MTRYLNGKLLAKKINAKTKQRVKDLKQQGIQIKLAVLAINPDKPNQLYMRMKKRKAFKLGIDAEDIIYQDSKDVETKIINKIKDLNHDKSINGILVQLPLPKHVNTDKVNNTISPHKDIDGVTAYNQGELMMRTPNLVGNTPLGIMHIIHHYQIPLRGKKALVIGRSAIVGRPVAEMLINNDAEVTILNHYANVNKELAKGYNVIVSAVGKPHLIGLKNAVDLSQTKPFIIDAGENYSHGHLCGDVDGNALAKTGAIGGYTPVPGGVGPMTIATIYDQLLSKCVKN